MDKKQKTLLGVLAVLVIGAGGAWYVFNSGSSSSTVAAQQGTFEVKQREGRKADSKDRGKRQRKKAAPRKVIAREREAVERPKSTKKTRRGKKRGKEKKKKIQPAA